MTRMRLQHCDFDSVNSGASAKEQVRGRSRRLATHPAASDASRKLHNPTWDPDASTIHSPRCSPPLASTRPYAEVPVDGKGNKGVNFRWTLRDYRHTGVTCTGMPLSTALPDTGSNASESASKLLFTPPAIV